MAKTTQTKTGKTKPKTAPKKAAPTAKAKTPAKRPRLDLVKSTAPASKKTGKTTPAKKPKLKAVKNTPQKTKKATAPAVTGAQAMWKILEERKKQQEAQANAGRGFGKDSWNDQKNFNNGKHASFARFAGPRRRAA